MKQGISVLTWYRSRALSLGDGPPPYPGWYDGAVGLCPHTSERAGQNVRHLSKDREREGKREKRKKL